MSFSNEFRIHGALASEVRRGCTRQGATTAFYIVAAEHESNDSGKSHRDFIPITTYGRQAESDLQYLAKGREVAIRGRIRSWYDPSQRRGGFCFEPDPGCVRYIGAVQSRSDAGPMDPELSDWLKNYQANEHQFDAAPGGNRTARFAAGA